MNEWIYPTKENVPTDILDGAWEVEVRRCGTWEVSRLLSITDVLISVRMGKEYRIRRPQPKKPTHEERMTKWWKIIYGDGYAWARVTAFLMGEGCMNKYEIRGNHVDPSWFTGRESADIPPESEG